ncbi:MAG: hypothetical protein H6563_08235 [Lewinellaceae bacterium]|nr:hypothetical protein [Lewinellaceae bacterium]
MKHFAAIVWCLLFLTTFLYGQVVKTNEKGEKIIEYPDGSWKPFVEEGAEDPLGGALPKQDPWTDPDPVEEARKKAIRYAELLTADATQLSNFAEASRAKRMELEEELADMKAHPSQFSTTQIQEAEHKLNAEKDRESLAFGLYNQAVRLAQNAENMIFLKPKKKEKALKKLELEKAHFDDRKQLLAEKGTTEPEPSDPTVEKTYRTYDPQKDTRVNPPPYNCVFTHNEVDKFTGKMRRDLKPVTLFTYTPKDLRPFLQDREYITCSGYLADLSDGLLFLSLEFSIASNNAPAAFGGIPNGSILSILMMNGESLRLINSKTDAGYYDKDREAYVYRAQFQISGLQERFLQTNELDQIRVIWSTGYEDYDVYELDFFRNQINCLRNAN